MRTDTRIDRPSVSLCRASGAEYVALCENDENRHARITFDQGNLELRSPTGLHERVKVLIGRCIDGWVDALQIVADVRGSMTFRREDLERGLEPDNCYDIAHASAVRGRDEIDIKIDPPPDLVIEVDMTSSSIDRMAIYAALGVLEVWRWHAERIHVFSLDATRTYAEVPVSRVLPGFPVEALAELIERRHGASAATLVNEFRALCRGWKGTS